MEYIYILTAVRASFPNKISRRATYQEIGYFTSRETAIEAIAKEASETQEEDEDELDDDEYYTIAFILEQKPTDRLYPNGNTGRWLFNHKGEQVDEEIINNYEFKFRKFNLRLTNCKIYRYEPFFETR